MFIKCSTDRQFGYCQQLTQTQSPNTGISAHKFFSRTEPVHKRQHDRCTTKEPKPHGGQHTNELTQTTKQMYKTGSNKKQKIRFALHAIPQAMCRSCGLILIQQSGSSDFFGQLHVLVARNHFTAPISNDKTWKYFS